MPPSAADLWKQTRLRIAPEPYVLASLAPSLLPEAAALIASAAAGTGGAFAALVLERDEVSITLSAAAWRASTLSMRATATAGPYRAITFDLDLDLAVIGYLAPAAVALAAAQVSIIPQCAYRKDHLLVREEDLARAVAVLESLIAG
jgi:hypothetical protein